MAPGNWRRPMSFTYLDNYRFGVNLYAPTLDTVDSKSRSVLAADRPDLKFSSLGDSSLLGRAITPTASATEAPRPRRPDYDLYAPVFSSRPRYSTKRGFQPRECFYYSYHDRFPYSYPRYHTYFSTPIYSALSDLPKKPTSYNKYASSRPFSPVAAERPSSPVKPSHSFSDFDTYKKMYADRFPYTYPYYYYYSTPLYSDYDLKPSRSFSDFDTYKKAKLDNWVPLSSYLYYPSYYSSKLDDLYNYVDDIKFKKSPRSLESYDVLSPSFYSKGDYWSEKCFAMQTDLNILTRRVTEAEFKLKNEVTGSKNKIQTDLADLGLQVQESSKYTNDLQRIIHRQALKITELKSKYDSVNRNLKDVTSELDKSKTQCYNFQKDILNVKTALEKPHYRYLKPIIWL